MLYLAQKLSNYLLAKLVQLSKMIVWIPETTYYVLSEELNNLLRTDLEERIASIHLVK